MNLKSSIASLGLTALLLTSTTANALTYNEGYAPFQSEDLWGYVNSSGNVAIDATYQNVDPFQLGVAKVTTETGIGVIRQDGTILIQPEFDSLEHIGSGLYIACADQLWGIISINSFKNTVGKSTQFLYPLEYENIRIITTNGVTVFVLQKNGIDTYLSQSDMQTLATNYKIPSYQFPLNDGYLPTYSDVNDHAWYSVWTNLAYNADLMTGNGDGTFTPDATLSVAEAIKLAAFMESRATGDDFHLQPFTSSPWYRSSVVYCVASGIMTNSTFDDYDRPITREEMALLFANTSLAGSLPTINDLAQVKATVPDVADSSSATAIYNMYAKGILAGTDTNMTFHPDRLITRAEAAAIVARMARTEQRITLTF